MLSELTQRQFAETSLILANWEDGASDMMAFDVDDHELVDTKSKDGIPIYGISSIKEKLKQEGIQTAILTVPSVKAQEVASLLVDAGIKGILSFSPVHLSLPKSVVVQYVDLTSELQTLLYFMRKNEE